jgi:NADP-dependent 3-hydroxy acid dehydrogenase YdfG
MSNLLNAVTVVTGASSGIGAATAKRLAASGAKVVLAARNEDKLRVLVSEITEAGGTATYRVTDVTDRADAKALAAFAVETYGPVDVLVNNAGLMLFSAWKDTAVDDWDRMIDTNLRGYLHAIAAVLPSMLERRSGRILNMSSVAGINVGETGWADKVSDAEGRKAATELNKDAIPPEAVADAVAYALDQPPNVTVNDVVIHPTKQGW